MLPTATQAPVAGGRRRTTATPRRWIMVAFLAPAFALYTVFIVYPLLQALQYSLFTWAGTRRGDLVWLGNFADLFTRYPENHNLLHAFEHNIIFFVGTMLLQNTVGLAFAVLLHRRAGRRTLRNIYVLPYLISPLVAGYLWTLILNSTFGPVNAFLRGVGLSSWALPWLGDPQLALPVVIVINAWQWVGFPMLLFGAALSGIPDEYTEAATVDGATGWQAFRKVTLPLLLPAIGTVSVLTFLGNFEMFALVYAIGGSRGGPAGSTDVLGLLFYREAFEGGTNAIGRSSALAVLMFLLIFGVSMAATRYLRRREAELT